MLFEYLLNYCTDKLLFCNLFQHFFNTKASGCSIICELSILLKDETAALRELLWNNQKHDLPAVD